MISKTTKIFNALQIACAASSIAAFGLAPTPAVAGTVVITPTSMGDWAFDNRDKDGNIISTTGSMVTGPATPPLGTGSANLTLPAGTGDQGSELRNTGYFGTALSTINSLSYSTYATAWNGQQLPYLVIYISSPTLGTDRLWFEPTYSSATQPATALNTWQSWNATAGGWYDDNHTNGSSASVDHVISWSALLAAYPDATIVNSNFDDTGLGGIRFSVGFASPENSFNGYVDDFKINDTTFDFEPAAATPLPAALPLFAGGLGVIGFLARRKKRNNVAALAAA